MRYQLLLDHINKECNLKNYITAWYLKDLNTGFEAERNRDRVIPASSIRKLFIMMAVFSAAHKGLINLNEEIKLTHTQVTNTTEVSGCLQFLRPGFYLNILDLITLMIVVSDNIATPIIANLIGLDYINQYCSQIQCNDTIHVNTSPVIMIPVDHPLTLMNRTTVNNVGFLLNKILLGSQNSTVANELQLSSNLCLQALKILSWQQDDTLFRTLLPQEASVYHKHGLGVRNIGDAGIFYYNKKPQFILVVMTDELVGNYDLLISKHVSAAQLISKIAKDFWDTLVGNIKDE